MTVSLDDFLELILLESEDVFFAVVHVSLLVDIPFVCGQGLVWGGSLAGVALVVDVTGTEGSVFELGLTAETYDFPLFSKSITTEDS